MKLTDVRPTPTLVVSPNTTTKSYKVDDRNAAQIARVLINAYKKPLRAVAREYLANAIDAHTQAEVAGRRVEVSLPTKSDSMYRVRDFGTGMSVDDAEQYFFSFGSSDPAKHASNDVIGGFGNGGKCAFTVCDGFAMTSVCNGKRNTWMIVMSNDGRPSYTLIEDGVETQEPSGTMVEIPIADADVSDFVTEFGSVSKWVRDRIDVKGVVLESVEDAEVASELKIDVDGTECVVMMLWSTSNRDDLIIGGFGYPVDSEYMIQKVYGAKPDTFQDIADRVVIRVPIGVVELAPTRETLINSKMTKSFMAALNEVLRALDITPLIRGAEAATADMTIKDYYSLDHQTRALVKYHGYGGTLVNVMDAWGPDVEGSASHTVVEEASRRGSQSRFSLSVKNGIKTLPESALHRNLVIVVGPSYMRDRPVSDQRMVEKLLAYAQLHPLPGWSKAVSPTGGRFRGGTNLLWLQSSAGNDWIFKNEFPVVSVSDIDVDVPRYCRKTDAVKTPSKKKPAHSLTTIVGSGSYAGMVSVGDVKADPAGYVLFDAWSSAGNRDYSDGLMRNLMSVVRTKNMVAAQPVFADAKQAGWWQKFGMKCGYEVIGDWLSPRLATAAQRRAVAASLVFELRQASRVCMTGVRLINAIATRHEFRGLKIVKTARALINTLKTMNSESLETASVLRAVFGIEFGNADCSLRYPKSLVASAVLAEAAMKQVADDADAVSAAFAPLEIWPSWSDLTTRSQVCDAAYTKQPGPRDWDATYSASLDELKYEMCPEIARVLARGLRASEAKNANTK